MFNGTYCTVVYTEVYTCLSHLSQADVEEGVVLLLGGVVVFTRSYIQQQSPLITEPLIVTVRLLHGEILHVL